jgi:hypothetical protein
VGDDIQARIDALPETVTALTICSGELGLCEYGPNPTLARRLPLLTSLSLESVAFAKVGRNGMEKGLASLWMDAAAPAAATLIAAG